MLRHRTMSGIVDTGVDTGVDAGVTQASPAR
jgi:hypothetical protein